MTGTAVVIPARMGSTRFPGKVLALLGGKPIVEWCWRAAVKADLGPVLVATESRQVADAVEKFGGQAILTAANISSGTDRVRAALKAAGLKTPRVINLQGDEPFMTAATLKAVDNLLRNGAQMSTAVVPLTNSVLAADPNTVKAAVAKDGRALYFSRSPIPYHRNGTKGWFQHIGIYGFQTSILERFTKLRRSKLEIAESLEQLRALEDGIHIHAATVSQETVAIDTPADLRRAARILSRGKS